jgi:hypothetical protein
MKNGSRLLQAALSDPAQNRWDWVSVDPDQLLSVSEGAIYLPVDVCDHRVSRMRH